MLAAASSLFDCCDQKSSKDWVRFAKTPRVALALTTLPIRGALDALRRIKVYPLAQATNPPAYAFVDKTDQVFDASPLRWEDNLQYWEKLHKVLQEEPARRRAWCGGNCRSHNANRGRPAGSSTPDIGARRRAVHGFFARWVKAFASDRMPSRSSVRCTAC
jgi:hypothetical protein